MISNELKKAAQICIGTYAVFVMMVPKPGPPPAGPGKELSETQLRVALQNVEGALDDLKAVRRVLQE